VSTYPAASEEINLRFMRVLHEWSGRADRLLGSRHGAVDLVRRGRSGANLLERHLTLDRAMRGPDHASSLEPDAFTAQVQMVREVEQSLGVPHRWITRGEMLNRRTLGKSLVAAVDIPLGTTITRTMLTTKSPGMGLSPQNVDRLVGRQLARAVARDDMLGDDDLVDRRDGLRVQRPIDVGVPWGIVARFTDVDKLVRQFGSDGMSFIEFHVSDRDLDAGVEGFERKRSPFGLVVHAPEYCHEQLIDLCSRTRTSAPCPCSAYRRPST
jgi:N-acetylneuraminate synthase